MNKIIALLIMLALFGCKSEPRIVDEASVYAKVKKYVAGNAANLLQPERLPPMVLTTYGVPSHEQARFLEIYRRFLDYRARLPQELQRADAAMEMTLELSQDDPGDALLGVTVPRAPTADDPAYVAYLLHLGPGVDSAAVADPGYVGQLAGLFQVTPRAIQRGLWIALQQDQDSLANALVGFMEGELKKGTTLTPDSFADKVLVPFFTYVSRGFTLTPENEAAIAEGFGRTLGDPKEFEKVFEELRYHLNGEEPQVRRLHALNAKLLEKDLFFYLVPGQLTLYRPHPYRIDIGRKDLVGIRALKARGPALRRPFAGCWPYADREIFLPVELVASQRDVTRALIEHGTLPFATTPESEQLWRDQGLELDAARVKSLYQGLAGKAFEGAQDATLLADLFFDAAVMQSRCQVDLGPGSGLDSLDVAIAAHGAQITSGRRPELHLLTFIQDVQEQRQKSTDIDHNKRLDAVLGTLWKMALQRQADALNRDGLRKAMRAFHDAHRTLKGNKPLPALATFERDIVQTHLAGAPALP
ncbi:MAG: hypothetical protein ABIJ09_07155 [Pseudomonadota bacterium]